MLSGGEQQMLAIARALSRRHVHLALTIADRGYILSHGELAASGRAEQLRKDSAQLAARYLGGTRRRCWPCVSGRS